jgi:hypothetical protein
MISAPSGWFHPHFEGLNPPALSRSSPIFTTRPPNLGGNIH